MDSSKITVEAAAAALVAEAEFHERGQASEFCEVTRVNLVVYVMLHLGLGLIDLGLLAEQLAEALAMNDEHLAEESWPAVIGDKQHEGGCD